MTPRRSKQPVIYTIGHSTRTLDELVQLLQENSVTELADVRTIPKSRRNPQFNTDFLEANLPLYGIAYVHMPALGGLRHARADSQNTNWENASFRGYADYMETSAFDNAIDVLLSAAETQTVAIMCAEAVPWRCHRSMIADELTARGVPVQHIMRHEHTDTHTLRKFAHVVNNHVSYR